MVEGLPISSALLIRIPIAIVARLEEDEEVDPEVHCFWIVKWVRLLESEFGSFNVDSVKAGVRDVCPDYVRRDFELRSRGWSCGGEMLAV